MSPPRDHDRAGEQDQQQDRSRNIAENTTLAISAGIILTLIALLLYQWRTHEPRDLGFEFRFDTANARESHGQHYIPLTITNKGSKTVEDLWVRVELRGITPEDRPPPASELKIRFLAGSESIKTEVGFSQDPSRGQLIARAVSFIKP